MLRCSLDTSWGIPMPAVTCVSPHLNQYNSLKKPVQARRPLVLKDRILKTHTKHSSQGSR